MKISKMKVGERNAKNGFTREVISVGNNSVEVKVVDTPEHKPRGRPPISGTITLVSYLKWLPKKRKIIQLTLFNLTI